MESDRHFVFEEWGLDDTYQIGHDIRFEHKFGIKTHWYKRWLRSILMGFKNVKFDQISVLFDKNRTCRPSSFPSKKVSAKFHPYDFRQSSSPRGRQSYGSPVWEAWLIFFVSHI